MDSISIGLALGPLAFYLLYIGKINLLHRPVLLNGTWDIFALGAGLSGMIFLGPYHLLMPPAAMVRFGAFVWLLLAILYALCFVLLSSKLQPRLVIYNMTEQQLRPVLAAAAHRLGWESRWAENVLTFSTHEIQLEMDFFSLLKNITLRRTSVMQNHGNWRRLERALQAELQVVKVAPNPPGKILFWGGLLILGGCGGWILFDQSQFLDSIFSFLWVSSAIMFPVGLRAAGVRNLMI